MCTGNIYGTRLESMEILLATNNKNKQTELVDIFLKHSSRHRLQFPNKKLEVIEDKLSIEENAQKKAFAYFVEFNKPVISDDSGLFVNSLNGDPGVYSSRFAGEHASDLENNQKLIGLLLNSVDRSAIFRTVLCFYDGKQILHATGELHGEIILSPRGLNGFGYDPIFEVNGKTLAEMTPEEKSEISHRKNASIKMVKLLNEK